MDYTWSERQGPRPRPKQSPQHHPVGRLTFASIVPLATHTLPCLLQLGDSIPPSRAAQCQILLNLLQESWAEVIMTQSPHLQPPSTFPLSHSAPATQASLQFSNHAKSAPASGPLHELFLLPRMPFPQVSSRPPPSSPSLYSIVFFIRFTVGPPYVTPSTPAFLILQLLIHMFMHMSVSPAVMSNLKVRSTIYSFCIPSVLHSALMLKKKR